MCRVAATADRAHAVAASIPITSIAVLPASTMIQAASSSPPTQTHTNAANAATFVTVPPSFTNDHALSLVDPP